MAKKENKTKKPDIDKQAKKPSIVGKLLLPVVLGVTSFCTVYFLPREIPADNIKCEPKHTEGKLAENETEEETEMSYINLEPFTVSLKGRDRILRLSLAIEAPSDMAEEIDADNPKLRDAFMGYLSALGMEQVEEASFLIRMRAQLTRRAQFVLGADMVQTILITDFMVR